jgi:F-box and leucine-rich repeat protein GRR1
MDIDSDNEDYELRSRLRNQIFSSNVRRDHQEGPISKIPPEVLLLVFSLVSHKPDLVPLLTVCKRWGDLIVELLWYRPSLMNGHAKRGIDEVMKKNRNETYWDYRTYIRRLNLSFIFDKVDDDFLYLFEGCPNLERLTLVNCSKVTPAPIINILQGCIKLQSIDMTGLKNIDDSIFNALADNCPRLQGIYAPGCPNISNEVILKITDRCSLLKRVKITDNEHINDDALIALTTKCKSLIEVDVHNCPNLTDASLETVFLNLTQLRELRISQNHNISDNVLRNLNENTVLERLRILDLSASARITDRLVEKITLAAPRLRNVVLSKCTNLTDSSLRALATLGKNLHYIHLGHCSNVTDFGVTTLVRSCHRLQYIDLACCTQLTNISLIELASLPRLKRIGLVKCANINDAGIITLIRRRGQGDTLERVHLSYCTNLSVFPIFQLLQSCPKLTHLSLTGIQAFLRQDITQFCRSAPPDFNDHQRALFCVFSGNGVRQLREHLATLCANSHAGLMIGNEELPAFMGDLLPTQFEGNRNFLRIDDFFRQTGPMNERAFAGGIMNGGFQQVPRAVQLQRLTTASASDELIDEDFEAGLEEQNIDNQDIVVDQEEPTETGVNRTNIRTTMNGLNVQDGNGVQIIDYEDISP